MSTTAITQKNKTKKQRPRNLTVNYIQAGTPQAQALVPVQGKKKRNRKKKRNQMKKNKKQFSKVAKQLVVEIATTATSIGIAIDTESLTMLWEHMYAHYAKRNDIAFNNDPIAILYYFYFVTCNYINRAGALVNAALPLGVNANDYAVPFAIAKYLEYLGQYKGSVHTISKHDVTAITGGNPFINPTTDNSIGGIHQWYVRTAQGFPPWFFTAGKVYNTTAASSACSIGFPVLALATTWADFLTNGSYDGISATLSRYGNTIPVGKIPLNAPDSTAYARCQNAPVTLPTENSVLGLDDNFDNELAPMFCISTPAPPSYSALNSKPFVKPIFKFNDTEVPDYCQLFSTWVYVAQTADEYLPGKFKDVFKFGGKRLISLYPQAQPFSGYNLGQLVASHYKQLSANKAYVGGSDNKSLQLYTLATVCYYALQRRINEVEVCHYNEPYLINQGGLNWFTPQFSYCDPGWDVMLPLSLAKVICDVGPVNHKGYLRIPYQTYMGKRFSHNVAGSICGPFNWSAFTFDGTADKYYTEQNLYSNPFASLGSTTVSTIAPLIPVYNLGATQNVLDSTYVNNFSGAQPDNTFSVGTIIWPMVLNGTNGQTVREGYMVFMGQNNTVNQAPVFSIPPEISGDETTMSVVKGVDPQDMAVIPAQPECAGPPVNPNNNSLQYTSVLGNTANFDGDVTPEQALAATIGLTGDSNSHPTASLARRNALNQQKIFLLQGTGTLAPVLDSPIFTATSVSNPFTAGASSVLQNLAQRTFTPNSALTQLADETGPVGRSILDSLFAKTTGSIAKQIISNPIKAVPIQNYVRKAVNPPKKGFLHKISGAVDKVVGVAKVASKVVEGAQVVTALL